MELTELFRRSVEEFDRRVRAVGDDQWADPTPCTEWSVRDLVNHIVYEGRWAVPLFAGRTLEEVGDRFDGDLLGDDSKGTWAPRLRGRRWMRPSQPTWIGRSTSPGAGSRDAII